MRRGRRFRGGPGTWQPSRPDWIWNRHQWLRGADPVSRPSAPTRRRPPWTRIARDEPRALPAQGRSPRCRCRRALGRAPILSTSSSSQGGQTPRGRIRPSVCLTVLQWLARVDADPGRWLDFRESGLSTIGQLPDFAVAAANADAIRTGRPGDPGSGPVPERRRPRARVGDPRHGARLRRVSGPRALPALIERTAVTLAVARRKAVCAHGRRKAGARIRGVEVWPLRGLTQWTLSAGNASTSCSRPPSRAPTDERPAFWRKHAPATRNLRASSCGSFGRTNGRRVPRDAGRHRSPPRYRFAGPQRNHRSAADRLSCGPGVHRERALRGAPPARRRRHGSGLRGARPGAPRDRCTEDAAARPCGRHLSPQARIPQPRRHGASESRVAVRARRRRATASSRWSSSRASTWWSTFASSAAETGPSSTTASGTCSGRSSTASGLCIVTASFIAMSSRRTSGYACRARRDSRFRSRQRRRVR